MSTSLNDTLKRPCVVIQSRRSIFRVDIDSLWSYRELLYFLVWRDVIVRYKQTIIGIAWIILQPTITVVMFTLIFSNLAKVPSDGVPYPVFAFTALVPWTYFSQALARSSNSVVNSSNLVTKIFFPRLLIPLAATVSPVVDFLFSFLVLLALMAWYQIVPTWGLLTLPFFLLYSVITALAVGLWSSALNVRYRDVTSIVPFLVQIWMYASPVAYPVSLVPEKWKLLYSLNPMVGVIEGFRWAILGKSSPDFTSMAMSAVVVLILFFGGIFYFNKMERSFADII